MMLFISILISFWLHPVHISVTEANYSAKDRTLQLTSRIFIDDLELSISRNKRESELDLLSPGSGRTTDQLVSEYLEKHLKMRVDDKPVRLNYLGHELEDVAIICYIESDQLKKLKSVEIQNDVIQEVHADQSNLVHVTYQGVLKSARLTHEKPAEKFIFN
jgi:hypothetical protein